jgi:hypothetical protein
MDRQLREWKLSVHRLWSATAPDYLEATRFAADIARASEEATLRAARPRTRCQPCATLRLRKRTTAQKTSPAA